MTTLLTVGNSDGERRCDAKCYNATAPECDCCCGGVNHGAGLKAAQGNMAKILEGAVGAVAASKGVSATIIKAQLGLEL